MNPLESLDPPAPSRGSRTRILWHTMVGVWAQWPVPLKLHMMWLATCMATVLLVPMAFLDTFENLMQPITAAFVINYLVYVFGQVRERRRAKKGRA